MRKNKLRVLAMVGGMELIGEMAADQLQDTAQLFRPFVLQCGGPGALALFDMTRSGVISGDSIEMNMLAVMWTSPPSEGLADAYQKACAGQLGDKNTEEIRLNQ